MTTPNDQDNGTTPDDSTSSKTFSQDDVNRIVEDRLKRERSRFSDYDDLKKKASRLDEIEDQDKKESEKLQEKLTAAEKRANDAESEALRAKIASEKGLTPAQMKRISGSTREELEADADEYRKEHGLDQSDDADEETQKTTDDDVRRPKENLRPGASNQEEPDTDPGKLAESVMNSQW